MTFHRTTTSAGRFGFLTVTSLVFFFGNIISFLVMSLMLYALSSIRWKGHLFSILVSLILSLILYSNSLDVMASFHTFLFLTVMLAFLLSYDCLLSEWDVFVTVAKLRFPRGVQITLLVVMRTKTLFINLVTEMLSFFKANKLRNSRGSNRAKILLFFLNFWNNACRYILQYSDNFDLCYPIERSFDFPSVKSLRMADLLWWLLPTSLIILGKLLDI